MANRLLKVDYLATFCLKLSSGKEKGSTTWTTRSATLNSCRPCRTSTRRGVVKKDARADFLRLMTALEKWEVHLGELHEEQQVPPVLVCSNPGPSPDLGVGCSLPVSFYRATCRWRWLNDLSHSSQPRDPNFVMSSRLASRLCTCMATISAATTRRAAHVACSCRSCRSCILCCEAFSRQ